MDCTIKSETRPGFGQSEEDLLQHDSKQDEELMLEVILGDFANLESRRLGGLKSALGSENNLYNISKELTDFKTKLLNDREEPRIASSRLDFSTAERGSSYQAGYSQILENENPHFEFEDEAIDLIGPDDGDLPDLNTVTFDTDAILKEEFNLLPKENTKFISEDFMQRMKYNTARWKQNLQSYGIEVIEGELQVEDSDYQGPKELLKGNKRKFKKIVKRKNIKKENLKKSKGAEAAKKSIISFDLEPDEVEDILAEVLSGAQFIGNYDANGIETLEEIEIKQVRPFNFFFDKSLFQKVFTKNLSVKEYTELVKEEIKEEKIEDLDDQGNIKEENDAYDGDFDNYSDGGLNEMDFNQNHGEYDPELHKTQEKLDRYDFNHLGPKTLQQIEFLKNQNFNITHLKKIIWEEFLREAMERDQENLGDIVNEGEDDLMLSPKQYLEMCRHLIRLYRYAEKRLKMQTIFLTLLHLCNEKSMRMKAVDFMGSQTMELRKV